MKKFLIRYFENKNDMIPRDSEEISWSQDEDLNQKVKDWLSFCSNGKVDFIFTD